MWKPRGREWLVVAIVAALVVFDVWLTVAAWVTLQSS